MDVTPLVPQDNLSVLPRVGQAWPRASPQAIAPRIGHLLNSSQIDCCGGHTGFLRRCFRALAREYRIRCSMHEMMSLDDRMLGDIDLTRTEITFAAHFGRYRSV